jgi:hypothetical protein
MKRLCDYEARLPDIDLSSLLGISKMEYEHLIHSPLYHYKNENGVITEFFMFISPLNCNKILRKLTTNQGTIVVFKPSEIFEAARLQFSLSNSKALFSIGVM